MNLCLGCFILQIKGYYLGDFPQEILELGFIGIETLLLIIKSEDQHQ